MQEFTKICHGGHKRGSGLCKLFCGVKAPFDENRLHSGGSARFKVDEGVSHEGYFRGRDPHGEGDGESSRGIWFDGNGFFLAKDLYPWNP